MNLRDRRIEKEWELLEALAKANRDVLPAVERATAEFRVVLRNSPAWKRNGNRHFIETEHDVRYRFPRYYPTLPLEAYFTTPILHPNVDGATGFACLWLCHKLENGIVHAVVLTRALMACEAANSDPAHLMQPDALCLCERLPMRPLQIPDECRYASNISLVPRKARLSGQRSSAMSVEI
jgi:ubiquitin-protein ligase